VKLNPLFVRPVNEVSQGITPRLPAIIGRWLAKGNATYALGPWLGTWLVIGVCCTPNLKEDSVESGGCRILHNLIDPRWIGRLTVIRPIKSGDPHSPKLFQDSGRFWLLFRNRYEWKESCIASFSSGDYSHRCQQEDDGRRIGHKWADAFHGVIIEIDRAKPDTRSGTITG
jgi:hypothetical protein